MKKSGIMHGELNRQLALLGHTDRFVVADSGLPLPRHLPLIDLAFIPGTIGWLTVLDTLRSTVVVQGHTLATESLGTCVDEWMREREGGFGVRNLVEHEVLKEELVGCAFAIRTGERTPYANVICEAGVPF